MRPWSSIRKKKFLVSACPFASSSCIMRMTSATSLWPPEAITQASRSVSGPPAKPEKLANRLAIRSHSAASLRLPATSSR
ncbi:hypothetical protein M2266_006385 [Streptomyces sp. SPB162]|nr:hypothetical protein [Streptomyces sp. SPB162]